ncbi:MAG: radical SAM family heme chaperone HemW [Pseudomonadota bacterium]
MVTLVEPPLSLYVHLPWCLSKCPYCDFNSYSAPAEPLREARRDEYVSALRRDIQRQRDFSRQRRLHSVFIGGGTPSLFTPDEIGAVLDSADRTFGFESDAEITLEVNPGALERGSFQGYRAAGVNRVSIGAQSFSAKSLQVLGRLHGPKDTIDAVASAQAAGFDRINLDVMQGLPHQDLAAGIADIEQALALGVDHVSHYQLTLEPNTVFFAKPPPFPDDETLDAINTAAAARLQQAGFHNYEVSAWARGASRSQHNLNYWRFGDYLAIGAGAHGKLTRDGQLWRYAHAANPRRYLDEIDAPVELERIEAAQRRFEFMLNALRLNEGFSRALFEQRTGCAIGSVATALQQAEQRQLLQRSQDEVWQPTSTGRRFLNDLQAIFLP